jgi:hypothetical protein
MQANRILLCLVYATTLVLSSCHKDFPDDIPEGEGRIKMPEIPEDTGDNTLIPNSQAVNYANAVSLSFTDGGVSVNNPFNGKGVKIEQNKSHIVITPTLKDVELNYVLSGVTTDGSVKIYGEYQFGLILNGVGITNPHGAAINIQCGKKVTVTVVNQTNNRLIDGKTYEYKSGEDMKATFFSEGQLNMYGNGKLEVRGKNKHAICTDDYFRMYAGDIWIKEAASDGIHANDDVLIENGTLNIRSASDGIESEKDIVSITGGVIRVITTGEKGHGIKSKRSTLIDSNGTIDVNVYGKASKGFNAGEEMIVIKGGLTINTGGDALYDEKGDPSSAAGIKCDGNMRIGGGTILIRTFGTEAEGLESKMTLTIQGGNIDIEAHDDCISASKHIQIDGGTIYCNSTANDGIDSNGTLTVTGGTIVSAGASQSKEGFNCDQNHFTITGGMMIGIGGTTSTPTANVCTQRALVYGATIANLKIIHIKSDNHQEVLTFLLPKTYAQQTTFLFSSPELKANANYTVYTGGNIAGGTEFHGLYTGATYTKGTSSASFTTGSMVSSIGNTSKGQ